MKARVFEIIESDPYLSDRLEVAREHVWQLFRVNAQVKFKEGAAEWRMARSCLKSHTAYVFAADAEDAEYVGGRRVANRSSPTPIVASNPSQSNW
jgi:hypothetical protein